MPQAYKPTSEANAGRDIWVSGSKWTKTNNLNFAKFIAPAEGGKAAELVADDPGDKWNLYWSPDSEVHPIEQPTLRITSSSH